MKRVCIAEEEGWGCGAREKIAVLERIRVMLPVVFLWTTLGRT